MDNVTHTLFALTLARTRLGRSGRGTTTALVLASNAPDIDFVTTAGGVANYLHWHRGPTHGPLGVVTLGVATAALVWSGRRLYDRRQTRIRAGSDGKEKPRVENASFRALALVSIVGVLFHVLMDLPTSYGTRLLNPFDWHWYAADWLPIVDVYLLAALAAGLIFGRGSDEARRQNMTIALVLMTMNYGVRAIAHHEALTLAPRVFGPTLPEPCDGPVPQPTFIDRWPRPEIARSGGADARGLQAELGSAHRCLVDVAALPNALSPFRWRLIAQTSNAYDVFDVNLLDGRFRHRAAPGEALWRRAIRYPNQWTPMVFAASAAPLARVFLGFARFPAVRTAVDPAGVTTVRWTDVRFIGEGPSLAGPRRPPGPPGAGNDAGIFVASIRVDPAGQILDAHLGP